MALYRNTHRAMIEFDGDLYHDDRMFVLYIARCDVRQRGDGFVDWTIYHRQAPTEAFWALVMYRNTRRYPAVMVDGFPTRDEAEEWKRRVEPAVPRISLGGRSPTPPPSYEEFVQWKTDLGLKEYDYTQFYSGAGVNEREIITLRDERSGSSPPAV